MPQAACYPESATTAVNGVAEPSANPVVDYNNNKTLTPIMPDIAKRHAEDLLNNFWLSEPDIWTEEDLPVDAAWIARRYGFVIKTLAVMPDGVESAIIARENQDARILLWREESIVSRRFACAYQMGRYFHHINQGMRDYTEYRMRGEAIGRFKDETDRFAQLFAAFLLVPEQPLQDICGRRLWRGVDPNCFNKNRIRLKRAFSAPDELIQLRLSLAATGEAAVA